MQKWKIIIFLIITVGLMICCGISAGAVVFREEGIYCGNGNTEDDIGSRLTTWSIIQRNYENSGMTYFGIQCLCDNCHIMTENEDYHLIHRFSITIVTCPCGNYFFKEKPSLEYCSECLTYENYDYYLGYHAGLQNANITPEQEQEIYNRGYNAGQTAGYNSGYTAGYNYAINNAAINNPLEGSGNQSEEYQNGWRDATLAMWQTVQGTDAYQAGYQAGFEEAAAQWEVKFQEGFDAGELNGFGQGYEIGYEKGYQEGIEEITSRFEFGVFAHCTFKAIITIEGDTGKYTIENFPVAKGYGYIYIGSAGMEAINDKVAEIKGNAPSYDLQYVDGVQLIITFDQTFDFNSSSLFITGDSDVSTLELTSIYEEKVFATRTAKETGTYDEFKLPTTWHKPLHVKTAALQIGRPTDLLQAFSLYSNSHEYTQGYESGYHDALNGDTSATFQKGYAEGFSEGKKEGLNIAKTGDWKQLITAVVEVPVNTFQSLFHFEILGLDMRVAFGAIIMMCVVVIILKKVMVFM